GPGPRPRGASSERSPRFFTTLAGRRSIPTERWADGGAAPQPSFGGIPRMNDTKETSGQPPSADRLPTFSILVETANLSRHTLPRLRECLDTLAGREVPPARAREVLLLENGQVPPQLLDDLRRSYPWLTVCPLEAGADYGAMKARSPELATGEVLLLCDSD